MGKFRKPGHLKSRKEWLRKQRKEAGGRRTKASDYTARDRKWANREQVSYSEGRRRRQRDDALPSTTELSYGDPRAHNRGIGGSFNEWMLKDYRAKARSTNRRQAKRVPVVFRRFTKSWGI